MENRRPGRNSPSQRPYSFDRDRRPSTARASGDGERRGPRSNGSSNRAGAATGTREFGKPYGKSRRPGGSGPDQRQRGNGRFDPNQQRGKKRLHKPARTEEPLLKITSDDQITDGKFRGKHLKNSVSPRAVHTDRKLREELFKIIARRIKGRRFLDLGAGCGTVGIESISRGTMIGSFVERSSKMCGLIRTNIAELGIKNGHGEVFEIEAAPFLKRVAKSRRVWDLVFMGTRAADDASFEFLKRGVAVGRGGLLIIEHEAKTELPEKLGSLDRWRVIENGPHSLTIFERK